MSKNISIYCLTLNKWRPSWICSPQCNIKDISDNTTLSGIPENPMIDPIIDEYASLFRKLYQFIVWPWTNGGHLGFFTHNTMSKTFADNTTMSGIGLHENPRTPKTRICLYYVENDINLLFDLGQMTAILNFLPTMQRRKHFLTIPLGRKYFKTL